MADSARGEVRAQADLVLVGDNGERFDVACTLVYRSDEPYAVQAVFDTGELQVQWLFARDLLWGGLNRPTGAGDVTVWPRFGTPAPQIVITLNGRGDRAFLEGDRAEFERFVGQTVRLVPFGAESGLVDVDAWIAEILAAAGRDARGHH